MSIQEPFPITIPVSPSIGPIVVPTEASLANVDRRKRNDAKDRCIVWDVPFDRVDREQAVDRIEAMVRLRDPSYVITANLNYVMLHHQRSELRTVTQDADLILADGQPIVWKSRLSSKPLPERVAGSEIIYRLAERAGQHGWGIYFLGGESGVAQRCAERLQAAYPGMRIAGVESPPFRPPTASERAAQRERIHAARPDLLLVAFGQPKGEIWIHENYRDYEVPVSIQLGASFDFVAGNIKRAPTGWQRCGLEWAYRLLQNPKRLFPRYAANARFLIEAEWSGAHRFVQRDDPAKS